MRNSSMSECSYHGATSCSLRAVRSSSVVEHLLLVIIAHWVVGSVQPGSLTELFFVPASAPQLIYYSP